MSQPMLPEMTSANNHENDPGPLLEAHFQQLWEESVADTRQTNPALQVKVIGFVRCEGDWVGVMVTPWFIHLLLLPGGGTLWGDIPDGQRRYLDLPGSTYYFTATEAPGIGPYQYTALLDNINQVADMATARHLADDALRTALNLRAATAPANEESRAVSRRGFFRRLAGKRD
ncbi:MAG: [NiFe]-hydrogenase assembly chaperone HybE [Azonexus sp.]